MAGPILTPDDARRELAHLARQITDPASPLMDKWHPEHRVVQERRAKLHEYLAAHGEPWQAGGGDGR